MADNLVWMARDDKMKGANFSIYKMRRQIMQIGGRINESAYLEQPRAEVGSDDELDALHLGLNQHDLEVFLFTCIFPRLQPQN